MNFMTLHRYVKRKSKLGAENSNKSLVGCATTREKRTMPKKRNLLKIPSLLLKFITVLQLLIYENLHSSMQQKAKYLSWKTNEIASRDWLFGFLKRYRTLSVRTPDSTSLGQATAFNRHNVSLFLNLGKVYLFFIVIFILSQTAK